VTGNGHPTATDWRGRTFSVGMQVWHHPGANHPLVSGRVTGVRALAKGPGNPVVEILTSNGDTIYPALEEVHLSEGSDGSCRWCGEEDRRSRRPGP
jgi:hypothetical protein